MDLAVKYGGRVGVVVRRALKMVEDEQRSIRIEDRGQQSAEWADEMDPKLLVANYGHAMRVNARINGM